MPLSAGMMPTAVARANLLQHQVISQSAGADNSRPSCPAWPLALELALRGRVRLVSPTSDSFVPASVTAKLQEFLSSRYGEEVAREGEDTHPIWSFPRDLYQDIVDHVPGVSAVPRWVMELVDCGSRMQKLEAEDVDSHCAGLVYFKTAYPGSPAAENQNQVLSYQKQGIQFSVLNSGRVLIGDEMGLGKTLQAIGVVCEFVDDWPVIVVVPPSLRLMWKDQLLQWTSRAFLGEDEVQVVSTGRDRVLPSSRFVIISYNLLALHKKFRRRHDGQPYKCVVADECHFVKNPGSDRSVALTPMLQAARRVVLLSGTAALNSASELWPQLVALVSSNAAIPDQSVFNKRYFCTWEKKFGKLVFSQPRHEAELHAVMRECGMIRRLKIDVQSEMPAKIRQAIAMEVADVRKAQEAQKMSAACDDLPRGDDRSKALQRAYSTVADVKLNACCSFVAEQLDMGTHKMLVFAHHRKMLDGLEKAVLRAVGADGFVRISGETPMKDRHDFVTRFQTEPKVRVALLAITSMSLGITMTAASCVIFAELHWTPGIIEQAEARAHRIGQENTVHVLYLILKGTVDEWSYAAIDAKQRHTNAILDGDAEARDLFPSMVAARKKEQTRRAPADDGPVVRAKRPCAERPKEKPERPVATAEQLRLFLHSLGTLERLRDPAAVPMAAGHVSSFILLKRLPPKDVLQLVFRAFSVAWSHAHKMALLYVCHELIMASLSWDSTVQSLQHDLLESFVTQILEPMKDWAVALPATSKRSLVSLLDIWREAGVFHPEFLGLVRQAWVGNQVLVAPTSGQPAKTVRASGAALDFEPDEVNLSLEGGKIEDPVEATLLFSDDE
mmetsp:Transcript_13972/g.33857  ORF Transcript_13972/g.33857 Transcript_13972/m.33857 type:complete len:841 (+) Transcript_13972:68-2590(+)